MAAVRIAEARPRIRSITPPEVVNTIVSIMKEKPEMRLLDIQAEAEARHGVRLTCTTVGNIMRKHGLRCGKGAGKLPEQEKVLTDGGQVSGRLRHKLFALNPALRERDRETAGPGERVCVTFLPVIIPEGKVYLHAAVDTWGAMAIAEIYREGTTKTAADFLCGRVLPFYLQEGVRLACIETGRNRVYHGGGADHEYGALLRSLGIRHEARTVTMPSMNGYMEKFRQAFVDGYVRARWQKCQHENPPEQPAGPAKALALMRKILATWISRYNREIPQQGYRNEGRTPLQFWTLSRLPSPSLVPRPPRTAAAGAETAWQGGGARRRDQAIRSLPDGRAPGNP
jgi:hypothetical protein